MDKWTLSIRILLLICHGLTITTSSLAGPPKSDAVLPPGSAKQTAAVQMLDTSDRDSSDLADGCRDISLHKCGSSMVRVFHLLDYLPWQKSYTAKCALRKYRNYIGGTRKTRANTCLLAFFSCMKTEDRPCKKRHWRTSDTRFRKKLARSLWSTRGCVLGALPNGTHV